MLSDSESELFITQSSFSGGTSIELSENNFETLFAGADNEKAVDNFNLRTEDLLTDLFTDKEDSGRGITTVTDTEIQARNEARIPQNTKRGTSWSTRVWDDWVTERNSLPINDSDTFVVAPNSRILKTLCNFELSFWLSKFVYEIRKKDKSEYPPNSLYLLCTGLQRYLRETGAPELKIFESPHFKLFQDSLDAEMKRFRKINRQRTWWRNQAGRAYNGR